MKDRWRLKWDKQMRNPSKKKRSRLKRLSSTLNASRQSFFVNTERNVLWLTRKPPRWSSGHRFDLCFFLKNHDFEFEVKKARKFDGCFLVHGRMGDEGTNIKFVNFISNNELFKWLIDLLISRTYIVPLFCLIVFFWYKKWMKTMKLFVVEFCPYWEEK